jgi:Fic family protein
LVIRLDGHGPIPARVPDIRETNVTTFEIAGTPYMYDDAQSDTIADTDQRVSDLRRAGRLSPEALERIRRYFRIKNIYHSNAIEGNQLDVGETRQVVELGLTLTGKPLRDQAEARNLSHALDFLEQMATRTDVPITEQDIRQLHALVLKGINDDNAGKYRTVPVEISGSAYRPPSPESVPPQMADFGRWLAHASMPEENPGIPGLVLAVAAHAWLVTIHPFIDGNGRVGRLLLNLMLMRYGYPIAIITKEDRARYYDALEDSQIASLSSLIGLVAESVRESLEEYERAVAEQREQFEWAQSIASRFSQKERIRAQNEYEVWRSAMDLLKSYFRQTAEMLDESADFGRVYFKDFGTLEFEKYASLRQGSSTKRTWFFRIDFRTGDAAARYLFFFGTPSFAMRDDCDVTAFVAREERPYSYERLEYITAPNVPSLLEIGYRPAEERFWARYRGGAMRLQKVEDMGRNFIEEVIKMHFSSRELSLSNSVRRRHELTWKARCAVSSTTGRSGSAAHNTSSAALPAGPSVAR